MTAPVKSKNPFARRIIKDGIRIFADPHLVQRLQRIHVENADGPFPPVADEPAPKLRRKGNTVHPRSIWNIADRLARIRVDHNDMCGAGDVEPPGRTVQRQVIPSALPAQRIRLDHVIARISSNGPGNHRQRD